MAESNGMHPEVARVARGIVRGRGFGLHVLVCDDPIAASALRGQVAAQVTAGLDGTLSLMVLDPYLSSGPITRESLIERLLRPLLEQDHPDHPPPWRASERRLVWLDGSWAPKRDHVAWCQFFGRLNEMRNDMVTNLDSALVLLLTPALHRGFATHAPDTWSIRRTVSHVEVADEERWLSLDRDGHSWDRDEILGRIERLSPTAVVNLIDRLRVDRALGQRHGNPEAQARALWDATDRSQKHAMAVLLGVPPPGHQRKALPGPVHILHIDSPGISATNWRERLDQMRQLLQHIKDKNPAIMIDIVCIGGALAKAGTRDEYRLLEENFLPLLVHELQIPIGRIVTTSRGGESGKALAEYNEFERRSFVAQLDPLRPGVRRYLIRGASIQVATLIPSPGADGLLQMGRAQLVRARRAVAGAEVRVALMPQPVNALPAQEEVFCGYAFDVVLHGAWQPEHGARGRVAFGNQAGLRGVVNSVPFASSEAAGDGTIVGGILVQVTRNRSITGTVLRSARLDSAPDLSRLAKTLLTFTPWYPLLEQGDAHNAAMAVVADLSTSNEVEYDAEQRLFALNLLYECVRQTLWDECQQPITVDLRERVTEVLIAGLEQLDIASLPRRYNIISSLLRLEIARLTRDPDRFADAQTQAQALGGAWHPGSSLPDSVGPNASIAEIESALEPASGDQHPWRARLQIAEALSQAGHSEAAWSAISALADEFPGRPLIAGAACDMAMSRQRFAEALAHAQSAFQNWPGVGQRIALIGCLASLDRLDEAWNLSQPLLTVERLSLEHLRIVAQLADDQAPHQAAALWQRYVERAPTRSPQRVRYAQRLFELGRHEQAREQAWQAIERDTEERLSLADIVRCVGLLSHPVEVAEATRERILRIADLLRIRFAGNVRAERFRLSLYLAIDDFEQLADIDLPLLEQHGLASTDGSELIATTALEERQRIAEAVTTLYERGLVPLAQLCRWREMPISEYTVRALRGEAFFGLSEPWLAKRDSMFVTDGELLVGSLELLLLHELHLLDSLTEHLRARSTRLVILRDEYQAIVTESLQFRHRPPVSEITRIHRLFERLVAPDEQHRLQLKAELDTWQLRVEAAERLDIVQSFVGRGIEQGWVQLIPTSEPPVLPPATSGDRIEIIARSAVLRAMHWHCAIQGNPRRLMVSADSGIHSLRDRAALASGPMNWLRWNLDGWRKALQLIAATEPRIASFAQLAAELCPEDERAEALSRLATLGVVRAVRPAQLIAWLCANDDSATSRLEGLEAIPRQPGHWAQRAASNAIAEQYGKTLSELWLGRERTDQGSLDDSVRELRAATHRGLERLEVLDPTGSGAYLEHGLAWFFTQSSLAVTSWWKPVDRETEQRGEQVDSASGVLGDLVHDSIMSWVRDNRSRLGACTVALQQTLMMLDELAARRSASPPQYQLEPFLWEWADPLNVGENVIWLTKGRLEALLILSVCWDDTSLLDQIALYSARVEDDVPPGSVSVILDAGVAAFEKGDIAYYQHLYEFTWNRSAKESILVECPPEALILRADLIAQERRIHQLAASYRTFDGVLYQGLHQLLKTPADAEVRRRFARDAVAAPWRHILHKPSALLRWGDATYNFALFAPKRMVPQTLDDLRALLSEPGPLRDIRLDIALNQRLKPGGAWESGGFSLALLASQLPNALMASWPLPAFLNSDNAGDQLEVALEERPADLSTGQCVRTLIFTLLSLPRFPSALVSVPWYIEGLLKQLDGEPEPDSLAAAEPELLRLCRQVIERLASNSRPDEPASRRDKLWLTYRLYGWLLLIVQRLSDNDRSDIISALRKCAPHPDMLSVLIAPAAQMEPPDILDPLDFAQDSLDHRLAHRRLSILNALLHGTVLREPVTQHVESEDLSNEQLRTLLTESSLACLRSWAALPLTDYDRTVRGLGSAASTLLWSGPTTVPDTALILLLWHDFDHFATLPQEIRLRWIEQIPAGGIDEPTAAPRPVLWYLLRASAVCLDRLSPPEQILLAHKLSAASLPDDLASAALTALLHLYQLGHEPTGRSLPERLAVHAAAPETPLLLAMYASALNNRGLELASITEHLARIFDAVRKRDGVDEVALYREVAAKLEGETLHQAVDAVAHSRPWLLKPER